MTTEGKIRIENPGDDSAQNCPAVNAYTRYTPNGPRKKTERFDLDIDEYAPKVVERMHAVLVAMGERTS